MSSLVQGVSGCLSLLNSKWPLNRQGLEELRGDFFLQENNFLLIRLPLLHSNTDFECQISVTMLTVADIVYIGGYLRTLTWQGGSGYSAHG